MRHLLLAPLAIVLAGCAGWTDVADNQACVVKLSVPQPLANCLGAYDVVYSYRNPARPSGNLLFHTVYNPTVLPNYVPQQGRSHCYAAALATGFGALGVRYPQEVFASAISQECFGTRDAPLTFSQIVFAATRAHAPPGIWYADIEDAGMGSLMNRRADTLAAGATAPGLPATAGRTATPVASAVARCQPSNSSRAGAGKLVWARASWDLEALAARRLGLPKPAPAVPDLSTPPDAGAVSQLDLYRPINWHFVDQPPGSVGGAIVPIRDSVHLIDQFFAGLSIVAGLDTGQGGHVVVIQKLHVLVTETGPKSVERHPSGYIEWVEYADPQSPDSPLKTLPGDQFMASARFLFGLHQIARK
jgi:hypothetical protein